jgi:hypothetical protein
MRIFDRAIGIVTCVASLGFTSVYALDGTRTPTVVPPALEAERPTPSKALPDVGLGDLGIPGVRALTPVEALRSGTQALKAGEKTKALISLKYAAEQGHPLAQWKLGRMYAEGDGVERSDLLAFEYFSRVANAHAEDSPGTPQARFVANAFVALGQYYLDGIPGTVVKPDAERAREIFAYAASYFGDPDAQYHLGRNYLDGTGGVRDARQAARWFSLAAAKGQYQAQAMLGAMLFKGDRVPRQAARGLMWLTLARDAAGAQDRWINDLYDSAFKQATEDERATALVSLERWLKSRRE